MYATATGYKNSETATATLCWIGVEPKTEGINNSGVAQVRANAVLLLAENGQVSVSGLDDGTKVSVYGMNGVQAGACVSKNGEALIVTNLPRGSVVIVKIGERSIKTIQK